MNVYYIGVIFVMISSHLFSINKYVNISRCFLKICLDMILRAQLEVPTHCVIL